MTKIASGLQATHDGRADVQRLAWFFLATFTITWSLAALSWWLFSDFPLPVIVLGTAGPFFAAIIVVRRTKLGLNAFLLRIVYWRVGIGWYAASLVVPLVLFAVAHAVLKLADGPGVPEETFPWWSIPLLLPFFVLIFGGQEEPGWRGLALPLLQRYVSALTATLLVGGLWALWHLPYFLAPGFYDGVNIGLYLVLTIGLSVIYTWLYNGTGGAILIPMVFHGAVNLGLGWYPLGEGLLPQVVLALGAWGVAGLIILTYGPANLARMRVTAIAEMQDDPHDPAEVSHERAMPVQRFR